MQTQLFKLPNGEVITYQLERRARRTIGLKITDAGLVVHAPRRIAEAQLNQALEHKAGWILSKLNSRNANKVEALLWEHGARLKYLGNEILLQITSDSPRKATVLEHNNLRVYVPTLHQSVHINRKVIQWYKKQAMMDFSRRLELFAAKLGLDFSALILSSARTRWGSCNTKKVIRLNWRLLQAPPHLINYVVCHELAHLKEMNHSARFWATVASLYPEYKAAEKELKALSPQLQRI